MNLADLDPSRAGSLDGCPVCGGAGCPHPITAHPVDQHRPLPPGPLLTPLELGYPNGIYVRRDGSVQDGTEDGYLLHGPTDLLSHDEAVRLGLISRPAVPVVEARAIHGPTEDRAVTPSEDRRRRRGPR